MSTVLRPLHLLLMMDRKWKWSPECEKAIEQCNELFLSQVLVHYDSRKPLGLAADASQVGVRAVLSHVMENGDEKSIAFASRTLSTSECNYVQIEEALSIICGIKKFHKYLYGRTFTLITDHKPFVTILGPKTAVPTLAALRIQRRALVLQAYTYEIEYRKSEETTMHCGACHCVGRVPQRSLESSKCRLFTIYLSTLRTLQRKHVEIQCCREY